MKKLALAFALLGGSAIPAAAQLPSIFPAHHVLVDTWYPVIGWAGRNGFVAGAFYGISHPLPFDAEDYRPPYMWTTTLSGSATARGSRNLKFRGAFPAAIPGWRFKFELSTERQARENYFGLGNNPDFDAGDQPGVEEDFNWAIRLSTVGRGEVQRRLAPNLWVLAGVRAEHWRITPINGTTQLAADQAAGIDPTIGQPTNDVAARFGLVFDSRSDETVPRSGVLLQAIVASADDAIAGDLTYRRATASASGYLTVNDHIVLAARGVAQNMSGPDQRIGSFYAIETGRGDDFQFDGRSHRGLPTNGLLGPDKLLFNFDFRYDIFPYPSFTPVTVVGWVDAGRVFYNENFSLTLSDMKVGAGTGLFLQIGRTGVLGITVGKGPGGIHTNIHSRWPF